MSKSLMACCNVWSKNSQGCLLSANIKGHWLKKDTEFLLHQGRKAEFTEILYKNIGIQVIHRYYYLCYL